MQALSVSVRLADGGALEVAQASGAPPTRAPVAQWLERQPYKLEVVCSIHTGRIEFCYQRTIMTTKKRGLLHVRPKTMDWNKHMKWFGKRAFWKTERQLEKKACANNT